jgi:hypothetical protein
MSGYYYGLLILWNRSVWNGVQEHYSYCVAEGNDEELARLRVVVEQGERVVLAVGALTAAGCGKIVGVQRALGGTQSEFEQVVLCFLRLRGMSTQQFTQFVRDAGGEVTSPLETRCRVAQRVSL